MHSESQLTPGSKDKTIPKGREKTRTGWQQDSEGVQDKFYSVPVTVSVKTRSVSQGKAQGFKSTHRACRGISRTAYLCPSTFPSLLNSWHVAARKQARPPMSTNTHPSSIPLTANSCKECPLFYGVLLLLCPPHSGSAIKGPDYWKHLSAPV